MNDVFGSSIMNTVNEMSSVDSDDFDEAFESIMDDYDESIEDAVNSMVGIATEGCDCEDCDCDIDDVDLSEDGDDIAEDDDDFYNTDDDLGIEEMESEEEASEVDLSETSEFDDDEDDAFEAVVDTNGTVNTASITTIYAEDDDPSSEDINDIILNDDIDIDDDEDITSDDAEDIIFNDDSLGDDDDADDDLAEESVQTFDDITKTFNSVLDSLT